MLDYVTVHTYLHIHIYHVSNIELYTHMYVYECICIFEHTILNMYIYLHIQTVAFVEQ